MAALCCDNVTLRHDPRATPILSGIDLRVAAGERVALVGLNGAGKTTLLRSLVGLVPHEGEVTIGGVVLDRRSVARLRRQVGFLFNVPEDQLLFPTVIEDVAFGPLQEGRPRDEALALARETLERLGLGALADAALQQLSHGQKQRVALAGALVTHPPLLLLDEPTAGLDPPGKQDLAELLQRQPSAQLIATHDLDFADEVCSRVALIRGGTIAAICKTTAPIRADWGLPPMRSRS